MTLQEHENHRKIGKFRAFISERSFFKLSVVGIAPGVFTLLCNEGGAFLFSLSVWVQLTVVVGSYTYTETYSEP